MLTNLTKLKIYKNLSLKYCQHMKAKNLLQKQKVAQFTWMSWQKYISALLCLFVCLRGASTRA